MRVNGRAVQALIHGVISSALLYALYPNGDGLLVDHVRR